MKSRIRISMGLLTAVIALGGCTATEQGAGIGAAAGSGLGAIIGHQSHHGGEGAAIGAAAGAIAGGLIGHQADKENAGYGYEQKDQLNRASHAHLTGAERFAPEPSADVIRS